MQNTNSCNKYFHLVQFQLKQYYSEIVSVLVFIYVLNLLFFFKHNYNRGPKSAISL